MSRKGMCRRAGRRWLCRIIGHPWTLWERSPLYNQGDYEEYRICQRCPATQWRPIS